MATVWQDASFRGAAFYVESFGRSGGRRGPDHEFPNKDEGYPEDTGKKMESFDVEAYVATKVGDPDYASKRDALIEALNKRGPGELQHPAFGTVNVQIRTWSEKESKTQLGLAVFSLSFREASKAQYPGAQQNAAAGMPSAGSAAHSAAAGSLLGGLNVGGASDFLTGSAVGSIGQMSDTYSLACALSATPSNVSGLLETALDVFWDCVRSKDFSPLPDALAAFPRAITGYYEEQHKDTRNADGTYRGIARLRGNGPLEPVAVTSLYRAFEYSSGMTVPLRNTATRTAEFNNAEAIAAYVRRTAIIEAARVAVFVNWVTLDDSETARDRLADALEREAWAAYDDDIYRTFAAMRTLVVKAMSPDNGRLPCLMDYTPPATMPSLALSHKLYGTADKADELTGINGLRHPGFFPGGQPIRILANA